MFFALFPAAPRFGFGFDLGLLTPPAFADAAVAGFFFLAGTGDLTRELGLPKEFRRGLGLFFVGELGALLGAAPLFRFMLLGKEEDRFIAFDFLGLGLLRAAFARTRSFILSISTSSDVNEVVRSGVSSSSIGGL